MKTQITYVLVSDDTDSYYEQLLISVYSLRKHNENARVVLVCDKDTEYTLIGRRANIKERVDKIIVVQIPPEFDKTQRSRFLKTNLRNIIDGDFLYIDTDTVICDSLEEIDELGCEIGAVREYNEHSVLSEDNDWAYSSAERADLLQELLGCPYFNGGILYVKDTKSSHELYNNWYQCWKDYLKKGLSTDQTALCYANKLCGYKIKHIDNIWNCQIAKLEGKKNASAAKIIHYFHGMGDINYPMSLDSIYQTVKIIGDIPPIVEFFVENPRQVFSRYEDYLSIKSDQVNFHTPVEKLYGRLNTKQSFQIILYNLKIRIMKAIDCRRYHWIKHFK